MLKLQKNYSEIDFLHRFTYSNLGTKKQASLGQESMIERSEHFLKWADENKHQIMIPTIVVAEILAVEPLEKYGQYLDIIQKGCMVTDFDLRTATKYAQILNNRFDDLKEDAKEIGITREKMKVDHLIIANAIVNNASAIYTTDNALIKFSAGLIATRQLPELPPKVQGLFTGLPGF